MYVRLFPRDRYVAQPSTIDQGEATEEPFESPAKRLAKESSQKHMYFVFCIIAGGSCDSVAGFPNQVG